MESATPNKPIRRSPALVSLSRDHHQGLLLCWKVRQGLKAGIEPARIGAYARHFFAHDLESHFRQEEEFVFSLLPHHHPQRLTAEAQHVELRELATNPELETSPQTLQHFADALDTHIRFEERTLFGTIEEAAEPAALEAVNEKLAAYPHGGEPMWEDAFWNQKLPA